MQLIIYVAILGFSISGCACLCSRPIMSVQQAYHVCATGLSCLCSRPIMSVQQAYHICEAGLHVCAVGLHVCAVGLACLCSRPIISYAVIPYVQSRTTKQGRVL